MLHQEIKTFMFQLYFLSHSLSLSLSLWYKFPLCYKTNAEIKIIKPEAEVKSIKHDYAKIKKW